MVNLWTKKAVFWISSGVIAVIIVILAVSGVFQGKLELPPEFLTARQEAGRLSQQIVELTNQTTALIKEVNISDLAGQSAAALRLIEEAKKSNGSAYQKAFELSVAVQKLAETTGLIESGRGKQLAYEATSFELALISNFISYTQSLEKFLNSLEAAVRANTPASRREAAANLAEVNQKILNINNLNRDFLARMSQLDSL